MGQIVGVEALHSENSELIDEPIGAHNLCGIHVIVCNEQYELLYYFLSQNFDINVQESQKGNNALHMAAENEDILAIEKLFGYYTEDSICIDDSIRNYEGKDACHVCSDEFKRTFIKIKQRGIAISNKRKKDRQKKQKQNEFCTMYTTTHRDTSIGE